MKHTQGPWKVSDLGVGFEVEDSHGRIIAQAQQIVPVKTAADHAERKANARLIAAAPELLEALELCRQHMYNHASNTEDMAFEKLCASIAKATGAQS